MGEYITYQQHEPLRAPEGWNNSEKRFIAQLEEIFDDIYRRFGRLKESDLSTGLRKTIVQSSKSASEALQTATGFERRIKDIEGRTEDLTANFVQLEEPAGKNLGDIWVQSEHRMWNDVIDFTWAKHKENNWNYFAGMPFPKTFIWNGTEWLLENDSMIVDRVIKCETEIVEQAGLISSKVSQKTYDTDKQTMEKRVSESESEILQNAKAIGQRVTTEEFGTYKTQTAGEIASKASKKVKSPTTQQEIDVESAVVQSAETWKAEFNKVGLAGVQKGITKIDEKGIEVSHSAIGGKTSMSADGFRLYDANGKVIGGLFNDNGVVYSAVQRLLNPNNTPFHIEVAPNIHSEGEDGIALYYGGQYCGKLSAYYTSSGIGIRLKSFGDLYLGNGQNGDALEFDQMYGMGHHVHYSVSDPGGVDGDIWLEPVEKD